jgi:hypothetical protein
LSSIAWILLAGCASSGFETADAYIGGEQTGVFAALDNITCFSPVGGLDPELVLAFGFDDEAYPGVGSIHVSLPAGDLPEPGGVRQRYHGAHAAFFPPADETPLGLDALAASLFGTRFDVALSMSEGTGAERSFSGGVTTRYRTFFVHGLRWDAVVLTAPNGDTVALPESSLTDLRQLCPD